MKLRSATREDYTQVKTLLLEIQRVHGEALPDLFKPPDPEMVTLGRYHQVISHPHKQIYVVEREDWIVGYIYAEAIRSKGDLSHHPRHWVYIHQLVVHPDHRRQGYGEALIQRVITFARLRGIKRVEIEVWGFNQSARSLYQKMGFLPQTERLGLPIRDQLTDGDLS